MPGRVGGSALVLLGIVIGGIGALVVTLVSARLSSSPAIFLTGGLIAFVLITFASVGLATRGFSPHRRRTLRLAAVVISAGLLLGLVTLD